MLGIPRISELDQDPLGQQLLRLLYNLWGLQGIFKWLEMPCVHLRKPETTVLLLEEFPIQLETFKLWYSKQNPPKSAKVQGRRVQHPLSRGRDTLWNLNPFFGQMMPYIRPECTHAWPLVQSCFNSFPVNKMKPWLSFGTSISLSAFLGCSQQSRATQQQLLYTQESSEVYFLYPELAFKS